MSQCPYANLLDPHFLGEGMDHEAVAAIRAAGPAIKIEDPATGVPYWAVTQHAAIDYVSKNNALFSSQLRSAIPQEFVRQYAFQKYNPDYNPRIIFHITYFESWSSVVIS